MLVAERDKASLTCVPLVSRKSKRGLTELIGQLRINIVTGTLQL